MYADFDKVPTIGDQENYVIFNDLNNDGNIDCTGTGASACELVRSH